MAKGYWEAKSKSCNYCGATDVPLQKIAHRTQICEACAKRNNRAWNKREGEKDEREN